MVQNHRLVLASGSPRRKELLGALDLDFEIDSTTAFEELYPEDLPVEKVPLYLAEGKSQFFHRELAEDEILITADTVVIVDGKLLGKPHSKAEARQMLRALSAKSHEVLTAVVLRSREKKIAFTDSTKVCFAPLSEEEIDYYNSVVADKFLVSQWVLEQDYWRTLFGDNLPPDNVFLPPEETAEPPEDPDGTISPESSTGQE